MNKAHFSTPGNYRIQVQGHLQSDWSDRFGGMRMFSPPPEAGSVVTILQGPVHESLLRCRTFPDPAATMAEENSLDIAANSGGARGI